jgi:uncharacterized membrane protein YqgA involved in biofilm formation
VLGPAVNAIVIMVCGLAGCFLVRGVPQRFEDILKKAIGLSIVFIGIKGAFSGERMLLLIMSMVAGALIGELINIDRFANRLGLWAEKRLGMTPAKGSVTGTADSVTVGRSFSKGFVTAGILFCVGAMAIVGSIQSGLQGNHEILFAKSILDGAISIVFGASLGIGVAFSAIPVFLYQASIVLAAGVARELLTPDIIREMSAVGSLLLAAIGFNFLGVKEIKVANFIPAIFIPLVFMLIEGWLQ